MAFDPSKYTVAQARPLPVILLLDCSGSMCGEKIAKLNAAVSEMLAAFKAERQGEAEIHLGIITFGAGGVQYPISIQPVANISSIELRAEGNTPMGAALNKAKELIEDKEIIPSKGYRPTVVLVSDGEPNDVWEQPMNDFVGGGRTSKCERFAMAIGTSQNNPVLNKFLAGTENKVFLASDASKIRDFFRFVTMSVSVRSRSQNPNVLMLNMPNAVSGQNIVDMAKEFGIDL